MSEQDSLHFQCAIVTDIGMKRKQNQDSGIARPDLGLFMVADGMGGHQGGETASRVCVEQVVAHFEKFAAQSSDEKALTLEGLLTANRAIHEIASRDKSLQGMGTTATILRIAGAVATIVQVGDSRVYYFNQDGIWQLTRDHSLVQEKLRAGLITRAQVKSDQMKNVITRSVGYESNVNADAFQFDVLAGDGFLICSDGLSGPVEDASIFGILDESARSGLHLEDAAKKLVACANSRGGDDNVTVVLVKVN